MLQEQDLQYIEEMTGAARKIANRPRTAAAWDRKNLRSFGTKLRTGEARKLMALCLLEGVTPYALIQAYLTDWIRVVEQRQTPAEIAEARAIMESLAWDWRRVRSSQTWKAWWKV